MLNWRPLALLFTCTLLGAAVGEELLVLQRQWQPTACTEGEQCSPDYKDAFIIQRLYQASDTNAAPQMGCTGGGGLRRDDIDAAGLDAAQLECAFYNATAGLTSQQNAWRDMWNAYGRCTAAGDSITYLATGLDLDLAYPLPLDLPGRVDGAALAAAVKQSFGATPQLTCQGGKLATVSLCFPADAFTAEGTVQPVDCPWPTATECAGGLQVPRGTQGVGTECAAYVQQSPVGVKGLAAAAPAPGPAAGQPAPSPAPAQAGQPAAAPAAATQPAQKGTVAAGPSAAQVAAAAAPAPSATTDPQPAAAVQPSGQGNQQQGQQEAAPGGTSSGTGSSGSDSDSSGGSASSGSSNTASSAQLSGSASPSADGSSQEGGGGTSTGAMVGALAGGVAAGIVAGMAAFGGGYYWWTRRRRTAPAATSPAKPASEDVEKGVAAVGKGPHGSSVPSTDSWSDAGSGSGAKRADSRSSRAASMPPSPSLPRRGGSQQTSPPRPGSAGSGSSGGSPPASTAGPRSHPLPGAVVATGRHSGRTSVDNPLWAPPASPGRLSSRALVGGWTATDNPLSADGSEEGGSSSGQGPGPLTRTVSGTSSGSSRRLARAEGASGSGGLASLAEGSPASGRALVRGNTWAAGASPVGPLAQTASGTNQPRTPYSPAANRSLPRTLSGGSMGSGRPLMRSGGSMGSGDLLPERSGPSAGSSSLAGSSGSKFVQQPPTRKFVGSPAKPVKYSQPAGRTPASATTKSFNARTPPPKQPLQRQPSKLDRLLSQGAGQAQQAGSAAAAPESATHGDSP